MPYVGIFNFSLGQASARAYLLPNLQKTKLSLPEMEGRSGMNSSHRSLWDEQFYTCKMEWMKLIGNWLQSEEAIKEWWNLSSEMRILDLVHILYCYFLYIKKKYILDAEFPLLLSICIDISKGRLWSGNRVAKTVKLYSFCIHLWQICKEQQSNSCNNNVNNSDRKQTDMDARLTTILIFSMDWKKTLKYIYIYLIRIHHYFSCGSNVALTIAMFLSCLL